MREADRRASEDHAMPSILLMERAGHTSAYAIAGRHPERRAALVVVGPGNNGGDGMVVARHLAELGWSVTVAAPEGREPEAPDAAVMTAIARSLGIVVEPLKRHPVDPDGPVVVDALLGTGATGAPRGPIGAAVAWLAALDAPVVSLDVPSGVEADTGRVPGDAVRAGLTVTYHGDMIGLRVEPGRGLAGLVVVADIGIPSAVGLEPVAWLTSPAVVAAVPPKDATGDKYRAGAVLVVAGAPGLTGAGCLCARAALRAGAGLVVAAAPEEVQPVMAAQLLEVMCAPVPGKGGHLGPESVEPVLVQARRAGAVAIGPGIGREEATTAAVHRLLDNLELPVVLDADGLWHLGDDLGRLRGRAAPTVVTPHAGEAGRLLGRHREEVEAGRLDAARELAGRSGAIAVLKGAGTIVAAPDGRLVVNGTGSPALATAGTGDVLTGAIAALLAKGMEPFAAAAAAVAAHGVAGELADRGDGTVAGDVMEALPSALRPR
jgi:NAD(P)H-hydrate epimerase